MSNDLDARRALPENGYSQYKAMYGHVRDGQVGCRGHRPEHAEVTFRQWHRTAQPGTPQARAERFADRLLRRPQQQERLGLVVLGNQPVDLVRAEPAPRQSEHRHRPQRFDVDTHQPTRRSCDGDDLARRVIGVADTHREPLVAPSNPGPAAGLTLHPQPRPLLAQEQRAGLEQQLAGRAAAHPDVHLFRPVVGAVPTGYRRPAHREKVTP